MNLSQIKREKMMTFLKKLKKENSGNEENLIAINEIENELNNKKYGLVWEEHEENVDKMMKENVPVFVEDERREIKMNDDDYNFLLEGDNLHSLYLLEKTHKGKIDVIYIDPPYNTGNDDFIYNDDIIGKEDDFRHSKWLSFMNKRLLIALELLSKRGVVFISIDDNEYSNLKILCDSIFGEKNYIGTYIKQSKVGGGSDSKFVVKEHEYCLVYVKNIVFAPEMFIKHNEKYLERYKEEDENGKFFWDTFARPGLKHPIHYDIIAPDGTKIDYGWIHGKERFEKEYKDGIVRIISKKGGGWSVQFKQYLNQDGKKPRSMTMDFGGSIEGKNELKEIFNDDRIFNYPKSAKYIQILISTIPNKEMMVLDFFAGSGTTAQAILELNKEDGGNRHFILCTNNENNICEDVTYKRIKTVITGLRDDGSKYSDGISANLKYYKTDFVSKDTKNLTRDLSKHVKELIQLENGVDIDNDKWVMILTEEDAEKFEKNIKKYKNLKGVYRARSVVWNKSQKVLLKGKEDHIIPDYYFNNELKEVGENW